MAPIRIYTFFGHPEILMIHVIDERSVMLPALSAPFETDAIASACADSCVPARVMKTAPGRWTRAILQAKNNERAERASRQSSANKAAATILLGSNERASVDRAELLLRRQQAQDELQALQSAIDRAKSEARSTGKFMPVNAFRGLEDRRRAVVSEYDAICRRLGEMRSTESRTSAAKFQSAAYKVLDAQTIQAIHEIANDEE